MAQNLIHVTQTLPSWNKLLTYFSVLHIEKVFFQLYLNFESLLKR